MRRLNRLFVFPVLGLVLLSPTPTFASVEDGIAAYKQEDYATALREFEPLAEKGDARAERYLGVMYMEGQGVEHDPVTAVRWLEKAADQGDAEAEFNLGVAYEMGDGVPQDFAKARGWYYRAAQQGHAGAAYNLAWTERACAKTAIWPSTGTPIPSRPG